MPQKNNYVKNNLHQVLILAVQKIKKFNWGNIIFLGVMTPFLLYFLFVFFITDMTTYKNWKTYTEFVYRIGFFFLTSIVSLSIFGSNLKTKLASASAFQQKNFYFMAIGITGSILMVITIFIANIEKDFKLTEYYILISKILFIIVFLVFLFILHDFLYSFWIKFTLDKNLKSIQKYGLFKKTQNINNKNAILFLTDKIADKLTAFVEMYVQNLVFLMNTKNDKILNRYIEEWNGGLSLIYTMIFHSNKWVSEKRLVDLFLFIMKSNSILMMESAKHSDLKDIHLKLVTNAFKVIPDLHEKQIQHLLFYHTNYNTLIEIYFKELCSEIITLQKTNNEEIYKQMASIELKFLYHHSLVNNGAIRSHFKVGFSRQKYLEDLFISLIFDLIERFKVEELPIIFSMMLSIPDYFKEKKVKVILSDKKEDVAKNPVISGSKNILSENIIRGCLYAVVKANEIENYRAAGYLIKVVTANASIDLLKEQLKKVHEEIISEKIKFDLITSNIHINNFSLEYCFKKTLLLFNLQLVLKKYGILTDNILDADEIDYLIEKLSKRNKEYNLIAIQDKNIEDFKDQLRMVFK
ncbi:hypothetical protein [Metasolibacillus sp.]|uniref:hypothetical protein n=1 Tax=Metasolibacillus sp. TaxID=2703680 RepID=UPI0025E0C078|nr:hypothetical protein [Metasolibacillus sp.]MCT6924102.1 hypothetical protein [Metasolibacillus sp.]MCT6940209.1 hypothetical protein [Metasolibacillus sp.]